MLFDSECTLINHLPDPVTRMNAWKSTILRPVSWQGGTAVSDRKLPQQGNVVVTIPYSVLADGVYCAPAQFDAAPLGKWTLREGDILIHGAIKDFPSPIDPETLYKTYSGCASIVSVSGCGFGSAWLRHWEVCAR